MYILPIYIITTYNTKCILQNTKIYKRNKIDKTKKQRKVYITKQKKTTSKK